MVGSPLRRRATDSFAPMSYPLAGVKNPVTVPAMVNVPSGLVKVFRLAGMLQVTVAFAWFSRRAWQIPRCGSPAFRS